MKHKDPIVEIGIDSEERLYVRPETRSYPMIYREAVEVHWHADERFLYSPKPREWSYFDWYKHILSTVDPACSDLEITEKTKWNKIPLTLRDQIEEWMQKRQPNKQN